MPRLTSKNYNKKLFPFNQEKNKNIKRKTDHTDLETIVNKAFPRGTMQNLHNKKIFKLQHIII